jgi:hypothetical protein
MSIARLMQMAAAGAGGEYQISRSLRFNSADSAYLSRTPASAGDRKTWTWSGWVKFGSLSETFPRLFSTGTDANNRTEILFITSTNQIRFLSNVSGVSRGLIDTVSVLRDLSAWYHLVISLNASATTLSVYINGVQQTLTTTDAIANVDHMVNATNAHNIGRYFGSGNHFSGYLTEINFIDGQALTPSSFGETNETTGVWSPIKFNGPWNVGTGVNGFYLNFSDNSDVTAATLGADYSGNGNNWTPSGFSVTAGAGNDSLVDVPTRNTEDVDTGAGGEVRGNYATLNVLAKGSAQSITNGNLDIAATSTADNNTPSTIGMTSGKWYFEVTVTNLPGTGEYLIGLGKNLSPNTVIGSNATSWSYKDTGELYTNNVLTAYGASYTTNDVLSAAFDADAGTLTFYKNGASQGVAATGITSGPYFFLVGTYGSGGSRVANFGQRPFAHTAPSGFKALVTTNLPEPTVVQGDDYFNTVLYPGNTPSTNAITGVGFAPDWVWVKSRTVAEPSNLVDRVRGDNLRLKSSTADAESAATFALNSDGFTVGANSESNTGSMVAWNWKANGAGASNTDGTVAGTVTVSANTIAKISIVTWTNPASGTPTIGHGLGVAPSFIIVKDRTFAYNWDVGSDSIGWANRLNLNTAGATSSGFWDSTAPTASVFTYAASGGNSGDSMVAYCFAAIPGFSAFGSYTGNGLADGPFVYTGFRPAFILIKRTTGTAQDWQIMDVKRDTYNAAGLLLQPNEPNLESDARPVLDILSNGFKQRNTYAVTNTSAETYIYAAFAENPFKYSLAR